MIMADTEKKPLRVAIYCRVGRIEDLEPHERENALVIGSRNLELADKSSAVG